MIARMAAVLRPNDRAEGLQSAWVSNRGSRAVAAAAGPVGQQRGCGGANGSTRAVCAVAAGGAEQQRLYPWDSNGRKETGERVRVQYESCVPAWNTSVLGRPGDGAHV